MIRLLAHPLPSSPRAWCLSFSVFLRVAVGAYPTDGRGGEGDGRGAKSYDHEKILLSIIIQCSLGGKLLYLKRSQAKGILKVGS
jgi:hypothetical protein